MRDLVEIVCVLDRSGSMTNMRDEAINAFNRFLSDQKALPGEAKITVALFDDHGSSLRIAGISHATNNVSKITMAPIVATVSGAPMK